MMFGATAMDSEGIGRNRMDYCGRYGGCWWSDFVCSVCIRET